MKCPARKGTGGKLYYEPGLLSHWCLLCDATGQIPGEDPPDPEEEERLEAIRKLDMMAEERK